MSNPTVPARVSSNGQIWNFRQADAAAYQRQMYSRYPYKGDYYSA